MAEAIARDLVDRGEVPGVKGDGIFFASAGTWAADGVPFSSEAHRVLGERGIALDGRSKRVTREMAVGADLVMGMTKSHVEAVRAIVGPVGLRCELALDPQEVDDPVGLGVAAYRRVADQLSQLLPARLSEMLRT